ncbi:MAG: hypothetical protein ABIK31_02050 [candidate division WOR-3 bacterium]
MSKVLQFLQDHNIPYQDTTSGIRISCFNKIDHKRGDLNPSLSIHPQEGYFHCWSCGISGSFPQLIAGLGLFSEIEYYAGVDGNKYRNITIEDLKKISNRIYIPGLGEFVLKLEFNRKKDAYIKSKKFTGSPSVEFDIYKEDSLENRLKLIQLTQENKNEYIPPSNEFVKVDRIEYLYERGIPESYQKQLELYVSKKTNKYFFIPIYNIFGKKRTLMAISYDKNISPRMFFVDKVSNPMLGIESLQKDTDVYIVEGWLDYLKLKCVGLNAVALLGNSFTINHYSILHSVRGKKFFIFDQDVGGVANLKNILKFVSISDLDWVGVFIDYRRYKDIGDINVVKIIDELDKSDYIPLTIVKNYLVLLGSLVYAKKREEFDIDGYTLRSDHIFSELPKKFYGI